MTLIGKMVGRYKIIEQLGQGGMAVVYKAFDTRLEREVALKVIRMEEIPESQREHLLRRFEREAKSQARFYHANIVQVFDYGEYDGAPYLVMAYLPGGTLKDRTGKQIPYQQAAALLAPIAEALAYAHEMDVLHRDVKPSNIMFDSKGIPTLADFGIAKLLGDVDEATLTGTGMGVGTPQYMAPEQWRGMPVRETDIYALGVVFYEMVTGRRPYDAETPGELIMKLATEQPAPPTDFAPDLPGEVVEILDKALAKEPKDRYASMGEFAAVLNQLAGEAAAVPSSQTEPETEPKPEPEPMLKSPTPQPVPQKSVESSHAEDDFSGAFETELLPASKKKAVPSQRKSLPRWIRGVALGGIGLVVLGGIIFGAIQLMQNNESTGFSQNPTAGQDSDAVIDNDAELNIDAKSNNGEVAPINIDCFAEDVLCIGLVTDVGQVDDKSFNQSAWEGAQAAAEKYGAAKIEYIETQDAKDYAANLQLFIDDGYDVIITVGFAMAEATGIAATDNPDVYFIGIDQFQGQALPNLVGLVFNEDKSGFLAGALAAMMSQTGTIAGVYGTDLVLPVVAFKEGYEAGAAYINPDIKIISTYHPGGLDVAFTDPEWGAATAAQAISNGADVIFGAGGKTGNGAITEAAAHNGVYCIGVDSDQWETVPETHACLISSAMKLIAPGVIDIIDLYIAGNAPTGNFYGVAGLAPYHGFDAVIPQYVKDRLDEIAAALADGSLTTGYGQ